MNETSSSSDDAFQQTHTAGADSAASDAVYDEANVDEKTVTKSCCSSLVFILVALALASGVVACVVVQIVSKFRAPALDDGTRIVGGAPASIVSSPSSFIAARPTNDSSLSTSSLGTDPSSSTAAAAAPAHATSSPDQHGDDFLALSTTLTPAPASSAPTPTGDATGGPEALIVQPTDDGAGVVGGAPASIEPFLAPDDVHRVRRDGHRRDNGFILGYSGDRRRSSTSNDLV